MGDGMNSQQQIIAARNLLSRYGAHASKQAKLRALELRYSGLQDVARFWLKVAMLTKDKSTPSELHGEVSPASSSTKH